MPVPKRVRDTYTKIKDLKIQGASNIAVAAAQSLRSAKTSQQLKDSAALLAKARSTEPLMRNAIHYAIYKVHEGYSIDEAVSDFTAMHEQSMERIAEIGAKRIPNRDIMTHCHSSTVVNNTALASNNILFQKYRMSCIEVLSFEITKIITIPT